MRGRLLAPHLSSPAQAGDPVAPCRGRDTACRAVEPCGRSKVSRNNPMQRSGRGRAANVAEQPHAKGRAGARRECRGTTPCKGRAGARRECRGTTPCKGACGAHRESRGTTPCKGAGRARRECRGTTPCKGTEGSSNSRNNPMQSKRAQSPSQISAEQPHTLGRRRDQRPYLGIAHTRQQTLKLTPRSPCPVKSAGFPHGTAPPLDPSTAAAE
jgi:hypothetical protein